MKRPIYRVILSHSMVNLRMDTKEVIETGLSFLIVIVMLNVIVALFGGAGYALFELLSEETCSTGYWGDSAECTREPSTASYLTSAFFWITAVLTLICGYIGLVSKIVTDSIAVGVYKALNTEKTESTYTNNPVVTTPNPVVSQIAKHPIQQINPHGDELPY
mgnify:CR=1 FL=1